MVNTNHAVKVFWGIVLAWFLASASTSIQAAEEPTPADPIPPAPEAKMPEKPDAPTPEDLVPEPEQETFDGAIGNVQGNADWEGEPCCFEGICGPPGRFWFRADYLLWWTKGTRLPPLVTTSSQNDNGVLGNTTTEILFGDQLVNDHSRSNVRIGTGFWLDHCQRLGVEFDWYNLGQNGTNFYASSTGNPLLARPFYDVLNERQAAELVAKTGVIRGDVHAGADDYLQSGGVRLRWNLFCVDLCCCDCDSCGSCESYDCDSCDTRGDGCGGGGFMGWLGRHVDSYRIDFVGGYRGYALNENVNIQEALTVTASGGEVPQGTTFDIHDRFRTRNEYHGGELGLIAQFFRGRWSLDVGAKVALGSNSRVIDITGSTLITTPDGSSFTHSGGLLALDTNIGHYTDDKFVAIPEINFELGYQINCHLRAFVGYNFLYWGSVAHAADQIDFNVNPNYIPPAIPVGERAPAFTLQEGDFWAHGMNFGMELRY